MPCQKHLFSCTLPEAAKPMDFLLGVPLTVVEASVVLSGTGKRSVDPAICFLYINHEAYCLGSVKPGKGIFTSFVPGMMETPTSL